MRLINKCDILRHVGVLTTIDYAGVYNNLLKHINREYAANATKELYSIADTITHRVLSECKREEFLVSPGHFIDYTHPKQTVRIPPTLHQHIYLAYTLKEWLEGWLLSAPNDDVDPEAIELTRIYVEGLVTPMWGAFSSRANYSHSTLLTMSHDAGLPTTGCCGDVPLLPCPITDGYWVSGDDFERICKHADISPPYVDFPGAQIHGTTSIKLADI